MRRLLPLFAVVAILAFTACNSSDDMAQSTTTSDSETANGGGNEGGGEGDGGSDAGSGSSGNSEPPASLSDDFAVGIAPGWVFDALGDIGMTNTTGVQLFYPNDSFDEVVAYYDDWTGSQSVEYARAEVGDDVVYQSMETPIILITVSPEHTYESQGETFTFLLIAVTEGG